MDIHHQFAQALHRILSEAARQSGTLAGNLRLAIAYSGGLDSTVLLDLCSTYVRQHGQELVALHIHHGLSPHADLWQQHCYQRCTELGISIASASIELGPTGDDGVEATARALRYAALGKLCQQHRVDVLLTAHHQDDQAETILLQLLRGSGIAGLGGMQELHRAPQLLGNGALWLARPLLDTLHAEIAQYAEQQQISHIEDESNRDPRYRRNALRLHVMPLLAQYFPGYQTRLGRSSRHAQAGLAQLEQLADSDYQICLDVPDSGVLNVERLQTLPDSRIDQVLRHWIALHQCPMPSTARLAEIRKQLLGARADAQVCVRHGDVELHRYRQQLSLASAVDLAPTAQSFVWNGEAELIFPAFGGRLLFVAPEAAEAGIDTAWLRQAPLTLRLRQGGERLKLGTNRPTRDMKSHYQTLGIPYWQRERLPFVFAGPDLVFAAGVGMNAPCLSLTGHRVTLHWLADIDRHRTHG